MSARNSIATLRRELAAAQAREQRLRAGLIHEAAEIVRWACGLDGPQPHVKRGSRAWRPPMNAEKIALGPASRGNVAVPSTAEGETGGARIWPAQTQVRRSVDDESRALASLAGECCCVRDPWNRICGSPLPCRAHVRALALMPCG